jgi:hypothetical protein
VSAFSVAVSTVAGAFSLLLAVPNVGPVVRAARADGVHGSFEASHVVCISHLGHEACSWYGAFRSVGGSRGDVYLYGSDRGMLRPGQVVPAVDTGRRGRVYSPSGSHEWILTFSLLGVGVVLFVPFVRSCSARWLGARS